MPARALGRDHLGKASGPAKDQVVWQEHGDAAREAGIAGGDEIDFGAARVAREDVAFDGGFLGMGHEDQPLAARLDRLGDGEIEKRGVEHRQKLFRHGEGRGAHAGAAPCDGENGCTGTVCHSCCSCPSGSSHGG